MKTSIWTILFVVAGFGFLIADEVEEEKIDVIAEVSENEIIIKIQNRTSQTIEMPTFMGRMTATFWILNHSEGASYALKDYAEISAKGGFAPDLFSRKSITPGEVMSSKFRFDELVLQTEEVEAFRFLIEMRNRIIVELYPVVGNEVVHIFRPCWARNSK